MLPSLVVLLTLMPQAFAINPGIKASLSDKGLKYGSHVGASWLQEKTGQMLIPDVEGDIDIKIGSVHYWLTSMKVSRIDLPEPTVTFTENVGIKVGMENLDIAVHGNWKTKFSFIKDGGTFDLAVFNVGLSTVIQLGSDGQGHLSVASAQCDSSIKGIDVSFHGGGSVIFQPFVQFFKSKILNQIQEEICPGIEKYVNDLESQLEKMQVSFQVNKDLSIELPLVFPPIIQGSDLEVDLKGVFYGARNHTEPPFVAGTFQLDQQSDLMLTVGLSEFTINSAAFAYYSAGLLQALITDDMIPKASPFRLNTTSFGGLIPQLPKLFPNMLMVLHAYASQTPTVSFQPDTTTLNVFWSSKFYGIRSNSTYIPFFRLDMNATFSSKFFVSDEKLSGSTALDNLTLTVGATEIGTFQTESLQKLLELGIKSYLLPMLNKKLKDGIPLPTVHNVQWVNSMLKVNKGFVEIATDTKISLQEAKS
ncbi:bactericidal permeability-increasing protein [Brienomyrus brachyistius]|uniref:bactericidal permeability-increasing protein n=1 Tax=Brienomyrus brachyistius TaxID=42636 RepID=UPI0020B3D620|nr:bactericidal permeability-increasing protein [Brienomyrus brachyistius]XP_048873651.1 bactericidal permeability-increasing protein [Brienomyrus brachyistius]